MQNKKIRNATPTTYAGVKYRSKLEAKFAKILTEAGVQFQYEFPTYELLPRQEFQGETLRPVTYTPDFLVKDFIIEVKGFKNDVYPLKKKLKKAIQLVYHGQEILFLNEDEFLKILTSS